MAININLFQNTQTYYKYATKFEGMYLWGIEKHLCHGMLWKISIGKQPNKSKV